MSSSDRDGKSVYVCFTHKPCSIVCFSQELCRDCVGIGVLSDVAQLSFNRHSGTTCKLNHAPRQRAIICKRLFGAVDHYRGIPVVDATGCEFVTAAVVQMKSHRLFELTGGGSR